MKFVDKDNLERNIKSYHRSIVKPAIDKVEEKVDSIREDFTDDLHTLNVDVNMINSRLVSVKEDLEGVSDKLDSKIESFDSDVKAISADGEYLNLFGYNYISDNIFFTKQRPDVGEYALDELGNIYQNKSHPEWGKLVVTKNNLYNQVECKFEDKVPVSYIYCPRNESIDARYTIREFLSEKSVTKTNVNESVHKIPFYKWTVRTQPFMGSEVYTKGIKEGSVLYTVTGTVDTRFVLSHYTDGTMYLHHVNKPDILLTAVGNTDPSFTNEETYEESFNKFEGEIDTLHSEIDKLPKVTANPEEESTEDLTKISINSVVYGIKSTSIPVVGTLLELEESVDPNVLYTGTKWAKIGEVNIW